MSRQRGTRESGSAYRYGSMRHRSGTVLSITSLGAPWVWANLLRRRSA